jgi:peptidoglycan/LPS O-acetylase OafA/YrhL
MIAPGIRLSSTGGSPYVPALDGLRFLAACTVLVSHAVLMVFKLDRLPAVLVSLSTLSGAGMTIFFVLSGFVIHYSYHGLGAGGGRAARLAFLRARFARLYPLYIALVLVDIAAALVRHAGARQVATAAPYYALMVQAWWYHVIGQNSLIYQFASLTAVTWSISVEVCFYLVYLVAAGPLLRLRTRTAHLLAGAIFYSVAVAALRVVQTHIPDINGWAAARYGPVADFSHGVQDSFLRWLIYFAPFSRAMEFAVGCLAANWWLRAGGTEGRIAQSALTVPLLSLAILSVHVAVYMSQIPVLGLSGSLLYAPLVAVLLYTCAGGSSPAARLLGSRLMRQAGDMSYSMYLLHIGVLFSVAGPVMAAATAPMALLAVKLGLAAVVVLVLSRLVFVAFEHPSRLLLRGRMRAAEWPHAVGRALAARRIMIAILVAAIIGLRLTERAVLAVIGFAR